MGVSKQRLERLWRSPWPPSALAGAYAFFGLAWILLSDRLLQLMAADLPTMAAVGQGKGVAFILATSGLLYLIARQRTSTAARPAAVPSAEPVRADDRDMLPWVFGLLAAAIVLASLVSYAGSAHQAHEQQVAALRQEAELKAGFVQGWIDRRSEEAKHLTGDALLRDVFQRWHRAPDETTTTQMQRYLRTLLATARFADVLVLGEQSQVLLAPDREPRRLPRELADGAMRALRGGGLSTTDFYIPRGEDDATVRFDLFVPLFDNESHVAAVLVLRAAPRRLMLPQFLMRSSIGAMKTVLFKPSGDGVTVAGLDGSGMPRQQRRDSAGAAGPQLADLADRAELVGSLVQGLDTEGVPHAAIAARIERSNWFVAVEAPEELMRGTPWTGATALALIDVLALLAAGAALYAAQQRRELRSATRGAADRLDRLRAWKVAEAIANCSSDAIFAKDLAGRYLFVNREMCHALGRSADQLIGHDLGGIVTPEQLRRLIEDDAAVLQADKPMRLEMRLTTSAGDRVYACTKGRLLDDEGRTIGIYGVSSDITERRDLQQRMRQWATAFEDVRDGVIITDALGRIQAVNQAFTAITGYAPPEATGQTMRLLKSNRHGAPFYQQMWASLNQTGRWQGEIWNRRKNGEIYPEWLTISTVRDDESQLTHYVGVFTDISRLKHSEAQNEWLAHHDPLTGLPNRLQLQRRLEEALGRSRRHESRAVLMVIDLDGFKTVNDSLGHPAGDELLVCVAKRLQARLRHEDFLGRLGGDEFLVIIEASADSGRVDALASNLLTAISAPVALSGGQDAYLTASIGISMFPAEGNPTAVELLRDADAAMYQAKEQGRNRFCFYTGDMNARAMAKLDLEAALSRAIEREELRLHYQPKVDGSSGVIVGVEALLRWQRGGIGLVPPGQFIPLAEDSSLILDIGAWVIDAACRQLREWMDAGQPLVRVAVNVAARQFAAGNLDVVVAQALARHQVCAKWLELELTEGMLISNPQASTQMLHRLRELGVKVSLDDFGTGYSSLAYLQQFPLDALKIDQSFVRRIGEEPDGEALVDAVIGLAHRLRLRVVAEGVETDAQREHLRRQGCDEMQGYYFSRPVPATDLQELLMARASSARV